MKVNEFVKWLYPAAKKGEISPVFVVAQAALETGWGKSKIGEYNLFGITKGSWTGKTQLVTTTEILSTNAVKFTPPEQVLSITPLPSGKFRYSVKRLFRDYDTLEQCLSDHFAILSKPHFTHAWPYRNNPVKFVEQLQAGKMKYATDPNYVATMKKMFAMVEKAIKEERL